MDFVSEFFTFFVQMIFWMFIFNMVFWLVGLILNSIKSNNENQREILLKKIDEIVHVVKVEKHNDTYYWFDNSNDLFLGQGKTDTECISHVKQRFPDHLFFFPDHTVVKAPAWQFEKVTIANE